MYAGSLAMREEARWQAEQAAKLKQMQLDKARKLRPKSSKRFYYTKAEQAARKAAGKFKPKVEYPKWPHSQSTRALVEQSLKEAGESGLIFGQVLEQVARPKLTVLQGLKTLENLNLLVKRGERGRHRSKDQFSYIWHEHA